MNRLCHASPTAARTIAMAFLCLLLAGCGGSGTTDTATEHTDWVGISYVHGGTTRASLAGTAWINENYYASNCVGLGCLLDTQRTNDFPGVTVTCQNLTTGAMGITTSYYGPGTDWQHEWSASVPITSGINTIRISAFDPEGKGGAATVDVTAIAPISVLATTPLAGATGVTPNAVVSATFSETLDPYQAAFTVQGPAGPVSGMRTVNDATVTFTPSTMLAYSSTYTVTLPTTLLSLSGASLAADYTWTFTTMNAPLFYVISTYPANRETGLSTSLMNVAASFSRDIDPNSVTYSRFVVTNPTGATVQGSLRLYKTNLTLDLFDQLSANTTYTATLKTGLQDTSGNHLPYDYSWTFTTGN